MIMEPMVLLGAVLLTLVMFLIIMTAGGLDPYKDQRDAPRQPQPYHQPEVIPGRYGHSRGMAQRQLERWTPQAEAIQVSPDSFSAPQEKVVFNDWFNDSVEIPSTFSAHNRITLEDWLGRYVDYCQASGLPSLTHEEAVTLMQKYAAKCGCQLDGDTGDFIGGVLRA